MPRRPVLPGTSISPRASSNTINEVVNVFSRKIATANNLDNSVPNPPARKPSFSMDNILHPHRKEKKHDDKDKSAQKDKRKSLIPGSRPKSVDRAGGGSPRIAPVKPGNLDLIIESPPLVFYGTTNNSSGALFSGRMKLDVTDPTNKVTLKDFTMVLRATISTRKPITKDCNSCGERHDELKTWTFLTEPKTFLKGGDNQFPFSYLFPGNLPATARTSLGSLTYSLYAKATTSTGEVLESVHPLTVQRAIQPGPEKTSIRIFPPTHLTGRVQVPPVVHPIGTFPVTMSLHGIVERKSDSMTRWRLRKMLWRIEEQVKVVSTACTKHSAKVGEGKAVQHSDTKILGNDEMKSGWKTDFDTIGGEIILEFEASIATRSSHRASCDVQSPAGLEVSHVLVIELIVAEEYVPLRNTSLITPTGAARVLRMQFNLIVTERGGMGISWDEEQPPVYEDVPPSPPGYNKPDADGDALDGAFMEDYVGPTIDPVDLERISTENPNDPPVYREVPMPPVVPTTDLNVGLPMRSRRYTDDSETDVVASGSRRRPLGGFRLDELEAEPMHSSWRRRDEEENEDIIEEDIGEGVAGVAPP